MDVRVCRGVRELRGRKEKGWRGERAEEKGGKGLEG